MGRPHVQRRATDLLLESLVVVISILIAFGLDAWWDSRQARQAFELDLDAVAGEVASTRAEVLGSALAFARSVAGTEALLDAMEAAGSAETVVVPDTIAFLGNTLPSLSPRMSALESFISAGRLADLEDQELRARLGALPRRMEDAVAEVERQRDVFFSVHEAEVGRDFDMAPIYRLVGSRPGRDAALPSHGDVRYPNRVLVRNHTRSRLQGLGNALAHLTALADELQVLERLLAGQD